MATDQFVKNRPFISSSVSEQFGKGMVIYENKEHQFILCMPIKNLDRHWESSFNKFRPPTVFPNTRPTLAMPTVQLTVVDGGMQCWILFSALTLHCGVVMSKLCLLPYWYLICLFHLGCVRLGWSYHVFVQCLHCIWWHYGTNKNYQSSSKKCGELNTMTGKRVSEELKWVVYSRWKWYILHNRKLEFIEK